jgi:hypothetical protein
VTRIRICVDTVSRRERDDVSVADRRPHDVAGRPYPREREADRVAVDLDP